MECFLATFKLIVLQNILMHFFFQVLNLQLLIVEVNSMTRLGGFPLIRNSDTPNVIKLYLVKNSKDGQTVFDPNIRGSFLNQNADRQPIVCITLLNSFTVGFDASTGILRSQICQVQLVMACFAIEISVETTGIANFFAYNSR